MCFYKPNEYQNVMLNIEHIYPDTSVCCIGGIMPFDNTINKTLIIEAVKEVIRLTPGIRLRLDARESLYVSDEPAVVEELHLSKTCDNVNIAEKFMNEPISLTDSPLYQFKYITTSSGDFGFMKIHHILGDHAALLIFFKKLEKIYFQLENGTYTKQESDILYIENDISENIQNFGTAKAYYKTQIEQFGGELRGHKLRQTESGVFKYRLTDEEAEQILTFCKSNSLKVESVFYVGLAFYQEKTTGEKDNIFGRVLMNRGRKEINVFGLYANTVPIFIKTDGDFVSVCKKVSEELSESAAYSSYPLNCILADNGLKERCYNMAVSFISAGLMPKFKMAEPQKIFNGNIELPMRLHIMHKKKTIEFQLEYAKEMYSKDSAKAFVKSVLCIIDTGIQGAKIESLSKDDKIAYKELNSVKYQKAELTVSRMFSEYAKKHGSETAVVFDGEALSFAEVENMANVIAEAVRGYKVVGIGTGRCKYLVSAMLGVLKSGGAYMPIAPKVNPPPECDLILTLSKNDNNCRKIELDKLNYSSAEYRDFSKQNSEAYLMRTSGSSGVVKTVKISNLSLCLRLKWMHEQYSLKRRILQKTNAGFDVSGWELWCVAFGGCCVMVKDDEERDLAAICGYIDKYKIEMIHFVPSMLRLFLKYIKKDSHTSLKKIISSGESLDNVSAKLFYEKLPNAVLYNLYGPTECTIDVTSYRCVGNEDTIPIGKPVYNTGIYIVSPAKEILPRGVKGEIVVTGELVGMGYTQGKGGYGAFKGENAYYTGDIGYLGFDGNIYYCGRKDSQIKLNGKRMNLAETEGYILSVDGVTSAAAIYNGGRVYAYYSADEPIADIMARVAKLTERLPTAFIYVKNMPFSSSGKINRTELIRIKPETNFTPPSNETERIILETAKAELNQGEVKVSIGVEDNLFDMGLDSLATLSFMIRLEEKGLFFTVQDIYANPTVRMLAAKENTQLPLVRLSNGKSDKVLCCFPYAGGEPQAFAKIAEEYENETFAVNYDFFDDKADVEEIANQLCEILKKYGEINIAASCAGSAAALETATRLEMLGAKIGGVYIMGSLPTVVPKGKNPWRKAGKSITKMILSKTVQLPKGFRTEKFLRDTDRYFLYMSKNKPQIVAQGYIAFAKGDSFTKGFEKKFGKWNKYFKNECRVSVFDTDNHYFMSEIDELLKKMEVGGAYD